MLEISRPDILSTHIQKWDNPTIQLPIEPYLKLLRVNNSTAWDGLNQPQIALINGVNSPHYRFITCAYSRRLGKTFVSNILGQLIFLIPNKHVLIMSPNYNLSNISFELQRTFIKNFDLEVVKDNTKDRVIELSNSSTIRMGSVSTVDSSVGRSYDLIIFDEAALHPDGEDAFNIALRPTLDKPTSKAIFISTPRGKTNWFSKFYNRGFDIHHSSWLSLHATYHENPRVSETDVLEAKNSMSTAQFEQEYLASFNTYEGQIYKFHQDNIVELEVVGETFCGLDPGYRDDTAYIVIQYVHEGDFFYVLDEYVNSQVPTSVHASHFRELNNTYNCETVFIDSAAAQFAADLAYNYDIATTKSKKDVLAGISFVQNLIETNRLKVHPRCKKVLEMLDSYRWDDSTAGKPVHDRHSHPADALRYALYSFVT